MLLNKGWTFHVGDNPAWAKPEFDDTAWESIDPTTEIAYLPQVQQAEIGWFRLCLTVSPAVLNQSLAVLIGQVGASEIYLNGRLIYRFGVVSADYAREQTYYLENHPFALKLDPQATQTLAVRYSFNRKNFYIKSNRTNPVLRFVLKLSNEGFSTYATYDRFRFGQALFIVALYLVLGLMYLVLYGSFRAEKAYLWLGIASGATALFYTFQLLTLLATSTSADYFLLFGGQILSLFSELIMVLGSHIVFRQSKGLLWWILEGYALFTIPALLWSYRWGAIVVGCFYILANTINLRLVLYGIRQHQNVDQKK